MNKVKKISKKEQKLLDAENARIDAANQAVTDAANAEEARQDASECMGPEYASPEQLAAIEGAPYSVALTEAEVQEIANNPETFNAVLEHQDPQLDVLSAEDVIALETLEAVQEIEASEIALVETAEPNLDVLSLHDLIANISDADKVTHAVAIGAAFDARMAFEKVTGNDNIQKTLTKSRNQLASPRAAAVILACNVDISDINRSVHTGKCYNVYAIGKLSDMVYGVSGGAVNNAINIAIMKTLFKFRGADLVFTGEMAKACASDKIRIDAAINRVMVRHTVSASTASTQASSTMQALVTLGVVNKSGSHKNPTYTLTDAPVTHALEGLLMAA